MDSIRNQIFTKDGLMIAGSLGILGSGLYFLYKVVKKNTQFLITQETLDCLRTSSLCAAGIWTIAIAPTFLVRKIGWDSVKSIYWGIPFRNAYTTAISVSLPVVAAIFTLLAPKSEKNLKAVGTGAISLWAGFLAAPLFFQPKDFITVAGFYTAGLTGSLFAALILAKDLLSFNAYGTIFMTLSTIFAHKTAIPFVLKRRYESSGAIQSQLGLLSSSFYRSVMLTGVIITAFLSLVSTTGHILYVQKCFNQLNEQKQRNANQNSEEKKDDQLVSYKRAWWQFVDGTDEISNGILIAGSILAMFWNLLSKSYKLAKKGLYKQSGNELRTTEQNSFFENLLISFIKQ